MLVLAWLSPFLPPPRELSVPVLPTGASQLSVTATSSDMPQARNNASYITLHLFHPLFSLDEYELTLTATYFHNIMFRLVWGSKHSNPRLEAQ